MFIIKNKKKNIIITTIIFIVVIIIGYFIIQKSNNKIKNTKEVSLVNKVVDKQSTDNINSVKDTKVIKGESVKKDINIKNSNNILNTKIEPVASILPVVDVQNNLKPKYIMLSVVKNTKVYSKASVNSEVIGSVESSERVRYIKGQADYIKIVYSTANNLKEGYVLSSDVKRAKVIPSDFNNLVVPKNVDKVKYGESGLGRPLYYYKIGNGKKIMLMDFCIHGYEDSWMQDGYTISQIGDYVIKELSERDAKDGMNGWSIYVIPASNPDGVLDGWTNNGPGRAQVSDGIDMNRDFPGPGFSKDSNARNKTQAKPLTVPETKSLASLVSRLSRKSSKFIVVDTHGWLDFTKGTEAVAKYFDAQYNLKNQIIHTYYGGYLVGYARMKGAHQVLIELPDPRTPDNAAKLLYNEKMFRAVNNIVSNYKF